MIEPKPYNGVYQTDSLTPYKLSRSKVGFFTNCPRCFCLGRALSVAKDMDFMTYKLRYSLENK